MGRGAAWFIRERAPQLIGDEADDDAVNAGAVRKLSNPETRAAAVSYFRAIEPGMAHISDDDLANEIIRTSSPQRDTSAGQDRRNAATFQKGIRDLQKVQKLAGAGEGYSKEPGAFVAPDAMAKWADRAEDPGPAAAELGPPKGLPMVERDSDLDKIMEAEPGRWRKFSPAMSQQVMLVGVENPSEARAVLNPAATVSGQKPGLWNITGQNSYVQSALANAARGAASTVAGYDVSHGDKPGQVGLREVGGDIGEALAKRPFAGPPGKLLDVRRGEGAAMETGAGWKANLDETERDLWDKAAKSMASAEPGAIGSSLVGSTLGNAMGAKSWWDDKQAQVYDYLAKKHANGETPEDMGTVQRFIAGTLGGLRDENKTDASEYAALQQQMDAPSGVADVMAGWSRENAADAQQYRRMQNQAADTNADIDAARRGEFSPERVQDMRAASMRLGGQELGEGTSMVAPTDAALPGIVGKGVKLVSPAAHGALKAAGEVASEGLQKQMARGLGYVDQSTGNAGEFLSDVSHTVGTSGQARHTLLAANDAAKGAGNLAALKVDERARAPLMAKFEELGVLDKKEQDAILRSAHTAWSDPALRRAAPPQVQEVIRVLQPVHKQNFLDAKASGALPSHLEYNPLHVDYGQDFSKLAEKDLSNQHLVARTGGGEGWKAQDYSLDDPQLSMTPGLEDLSTGMPRPLTRDVAEARSGVLPASARNLEQVTKDRVDRLTKRGEFSPWNRMEANEFAKEMEGVDALTGLVRSGQRAASHGRAGPQAAAAVVQEDLPLLREQARMNGHSMKYGGKDVPVAPDFEDITKHPKFENDAIYGGPQVTAKGEERGLAKAEAAHAKVISEAEYKALMDEAHALNKEWKKARTQANSMRIAEKAEGRKRVDLDRVENAAGRKLQASVRRTGKAADAQAMAESKVAGAGANSPLEMNAWLKSSKAGEARAALEQGRKDAVSNIKLTYAEAEARADAARERATDATMRLNEATKARKATQARIPEDMKDAQIAARDARGAVANKGVLSDPVMADLAASNSVILRTKANKTLPVDVEYGDRVVTVPDEFAYLENHKVPKAFALSLNQVAKPASERLSSKAHHVAKVIDNVLGMGQMKKLITQGNMGFEARNITGNIMRVASNDPAALGSQRMRAQVARISNATFDDKAIEYVAGKPYTRGELKTMMVRDAGVGVGSRDRLLATEVRKPGVGTAGELILGAPGALVERAGRMAGSKGVEAFGSKAKAALPGAANWAADAATKPGSAVNEMADRAGRDIFATGSGTKLNHAFNTDDGLRMLSVIGGMERGMTRQAAIREMKHLLIDYSTSSAAKESIGAFVPFIKYYTGAFQGAAQLALKHPRRYARFHDLMRSTEALDRSVNDQKMTDPRMKPLLDRASFNPEVTIADGEKMTLRAEQHGAELANLVAMAAGTAGVNTLLPDGWDAMSDERGVMGAVHPLYSQLYAGLTGKDAATGASIYGMSPDEVKSFPSGAYDQYQGALRLQKEAGVNHLGSYPELNAAYAAAKYAPLFGGRFLPPQADMLARAGQGLGSSPASKSTDSRASALQRGLLSAILGVRGTVKNRQRQFSQAQHNRVQNTPGSLGKIIAREKGRQ